MTENRRPIDHALDLFVFAPLGFALEARELLPQMIERGRTQVNGRVTMARVVGQFAVKQGQVEAEKRFGPLQEQAATALADLGLSARERPSSPDVPRTDGAVAPVVTDPEPAADPAPVLDDADLAVPGYDSLAASQVIPRLAGLSADELEQVREYESAKRGRKTILNKIAQLQAS